MIYILLANGFEEIEALTVVDVLRRAQIQAVMVSCEEALEVTGAHNIPVKADMLLSDCRADEAEMVVLPGGMPGTLNLKYNPSVIALLEEAISKQKRIAAICAAPMVLGTNGWLSGKNATCYPGFEKDLEGAFPSDDRVVVDGNFTTSKGPGTALEFALELVRLLSGEETMHELASGMIFKG